MQNSKFLITGGTGSFGKAVTRHLLNKGVKEIRIFSRDETKQDQMRNDFNDDRIQYYIGNVREYESINSAMVGIDYVFHAAALKQVPSCDFFPMQAVKTNICGSDNVIQASIQNTVKRIICLSTDKAVMPINAMGMTKALMEKMAFAMARGLSSNHTIISCVRYGNVMCSRGSVIPLFIQQIKQKKPITITEPTMTRFLLALRDAVSLVEFALKHAEQGDLFIKKAPACTVQDLADALMEIFEADIPSRVIGIRHGEKIYETLATCEELRRAEDMGDYFRVKADFRNLSYANFFTKGDTKENLTEDYHSHGTTRLSKEEVKSLLLSLPEVQAELRYS